MGAMTMFSRQQRGAGRLPAGREIVGCDGGWCLGSFASENAS
jgi:hypothetical protein